MTTIRIGNNPGGGTVGGILDTQLSQLTPTVNYGTASSSYLDAGASGQINRQVMDFDLTPLAGLIINVTASSISINNADAVGSTRAVEVRKLISTFIETQATWNVRATATNWNVAGVLGGTDVDATVIATGTMPTGGNNRFTMTGSGLSQAIQDAVNAGQTSLRLIISVLNDTSTFDGVSRRVNNRDNPTVANRPWMDITYDVVTPPSVSIGDVLVSKYSGTATFPVTLSSSYATSLSVTVDLNDGTAIAARDYVDNTVVVTFAPGETSKTAVATILNP